MFVDGEYDDGFLYAGSYDGGHVYRFLVVVHMAAVLIALIVGIAVAHHTQQPRDRENESTFERQAPQLENWPTHHRPLQRG